MKSTTELAADVIAETLAHLEIYAWVSDSTDIAHALDAAGLLKNELQYLYGQELRREWAERARRRHQLGIQP